jgi:uncharacterized FlaG/YvyC family protein
MKIFAGTVDSEQTGGVKGVLLPPFCLVMAQRNQGVMNMQMAKTSMDAGTYVKSVNTPEKLRLVRETKNGTAAETNRPAGERESAARAGAVQAPPEQEMDPDHFREAIEETNKRYEAYDRLLQFSVHEETRQIVIKIINTKTEEVIAEIPPEKILDMIAQLWEMAGLLVDKRA